MRCPACRFDNFEGEDSCSACGADLRTADIPQPVTEYGATVLGARLGTLGLAAPATVTPAVPVAEAIRRMHAEALEVLCVVEGGRLAGVFTDRDAVVRVPAGTPAGLTVGEVMTRDPVVCGPEDTLALAIHHMGDGGFRHLPVVDGGRPVGVLAAADVFRLLADVTAGA